MSWGSRSGPRERSLPVRRWSVAKGHGAAILGLARRCARLDRGEPAGQTVDLARLARDHVGKVGIGAVEMGETRLERLDPVVGHQVAPPHPVG